MLEVIDLSDWKTKATILRELADMDMPTHERVLRKEIKHHNELYWQGERDLYIAESNKGYILTDDANIIMKSIGDKHSRAMNMLYEESQVKKRLGLSLMTPLELFREVND